MQPSNEQYPQHNAVPEQPMMPEQPVFPSSLGLPAAQADFNVAGQTIPQPEVSYQQPMTYEQQFVQPEVPYQRPMTYEQQPVHPEVSYQQPMTYEQQPVQPEVSYQQPMAYEQQSVQPEVPYQQPMTYEQQFVQPEVSYQQPMTYEQQPVQPEVSYQQPIVLPEATYEQPEHLEAMLPEQLVTLPTTPQPNVQQALVPEIPESKIKYTNENVKSVLFFMNGFGLSAPKSYNLYSATLMPSLAKISNHYPFVGVFASGAEVGLNKGQLSSFKAGYLAFSCAGKPNKKSTVVESKIREGAFDTNPAIVASIQHAVQNKSRLHILFCIGDRTEERQFAQLKRYGQLAASNGVTDICVHAFLGDNSVTGLKVSAGWLKNLKYQVINFIPQMRLVSIAGRKYLEDASKEEKVSYYRMVVSGVGEVWVNYEDTLAKKYEGKFDDNNMGGFLTVRENILRANDSAMFFNYDNSVGAEYLDILQKPSIYFPAGGKIPLNVLVNSLFEVSGNENVPYGFDNDLPEDYFFEKIPADKKILIIADSDRIEYISKCLNGFRPEFKQNVNVWPIEDKKKRFEMLAKNLSAYISKDYYDLIIADCELYNEKIDEKNINALRKNMALIDKCLNVAYTKSIEKGYTLYVSSLYGIKTTLLLTKTYEHVDFSQKAPFIVAGKDVSKATVSLPIDGNFTQISHVIQRNMGVPVKASLVSYKNARDKNKKVIMLGGLVLLVFLAFVVYVILYNQGYI